MCSFAPCTPDLEQSLELHVTSTFDQQIAPGISLRVLALQR